MSTNLPSNSELPSEDEHVLHMWEPMKYTVRRGYNYRRAGFFGTLGNFLIRLFAQIILRPFNYIAFGMRIRGRENLRALGRSGAVLTCNHVHPMDCTFIDIAATGRRIYYVTLETNFKIPFVRLLIRGLGGVPLPSNPANMADMFSQMEIALHRGALVTMYPEGVLHPYYEGLRRFKNGAFKLAADAGCPILPCAITYRAPRGLFKLYKKRRPCMTVNILPPIYPDADSKSAAQTARLRELTVAATAEALGCAEKAKDKQLSV